MVSRKAGVEILEITISIDNTATALHGSELLLGERSSVQLLLFIVPILVELDGSEITLQGLRLVSTISNRKFLQLLVLLGLLYGRNSKSVGSLVLDYPLLHHGMVR